MQLQRKWTNCEFAQNLLDNGVQWCITLEPNQGIIKKKKSSLLDDINFIAGKQRVCPHWLFTDGLPFYWITRYNNNRPTALLVLSTRYQQSFLIY